MANTTNNDKKKKKKLTFPAADIKAGAPTTLGDFTGKVEHFGVADGKPTKDVVGVDYFVKGEPATAERFKPGFRSIITKPKPDIKKEEMISKVKQIPEGEVDVDKGVGITDVTAPKVDEVEVEKEKGFFRKAGEAIIAPTKAQWQLFMGDTAGVIPVSAGEKGKAEFDEEKAAKLGRRVIAGVTIGAFPTISAVLTGRTFTLVSGLIGASGIATWLASDNIATGTGIHSKSIASDVEGGVITAEVGTENLNKMQGTLNTARSFVNWNTMANPIMWPFRKMFMLNLDLAQTNLDSSRDRVDVVGAGGTQQQQFFDIIQKEKLEEQRTSDLAADIRRTETIEKAEAGGGSAVYTQLP